MRSGRRPAPERPSRGRYAGRFGPPDDSVRIGNRTRAVLAACQMGYGGNVEIALALKGL